MVKLTEQQPIRILVHYPGPYFVVEILSTTTTPGRWIATNAGYNPATLAAWIDRHYPGRHPEIVPIDHTRKEPNR